MMPSTSKPGGSHSNHAETLGEVINELLAEGLKLVAPPPARRSLGRLRGTIRIADDFDDTPREVLDSLDSPL